MSGFLIWFVPLNLAGVLAAVGCGIRIRTAPPAQRLIAWVQFGAVCLWLPFNAALWWVILDLYAQEGRPFPGPPGWMIVCTVPFMVTMIPVSVVYLTRELRQARADRTASIDVPPEE